MLIAARPAVGLVIHSVGPALHLTRSRSPVAGDVASGPGWLPGTHSTLARYCLVGWQREPYPAASPLHVSVWRR